jgi:hypothetical protein
MECGTRIGLAKDQRTWDDSVCPRLGKQRYSLRPNATIDDDLRAAACLGTKL